MKRTFSACVAVILLVSMLIGCSAYSNPEKYVTLPAKGSVSISRAEIDKQINEDIDDMLESGREANYEELTDADATVAKGDQVKLSYEGKPVNTKLELTDDELAKMKSESYDLVIGSGSFIGAYESTDKVKDNPGFEDQLIGLKKGEKKTITVTFPDVYESNTKLQGEVVNFDVEILTISRDLIDDKDTAELSYEFELPEDLKDEEEPAEEEPSEEAPADEDEAKASADEADTGDTTTTGSDDTTTTGEGETSGEKTKEELKALFDELFDEGKFDIDFSDPDSYKDKKFNTIFSVSDIASEIKGKAIYAEIEIKLTVPEGNDTYKEFFGKEITVKFTVEKVTALPELTDDYVKEQSNETYSTVAEYKEALEKNIIASLAFDAILEATVVNEYPKKELETVYKNSIDSQVQQKLNGSPSSFSQSELDEVLTDSVYQEIYATAAATAYSSVKQRLVIEALFNAYDITLSSKEYKEKLEEYYASVQTDYYSAYMLAYYGITDIDAFEDYYGKESLELQFKNQKLNEVIGDYVTIGE